MMISPFIPVGPEIHRPFPPDAAGNDFRIAQRQKAEI
jgi:hypothetical protein